MQPQDLFHLLTNGFYRVERITGILRDLADAHSAQAVQAFIRPVANHFAIEDNPPGIPAGIIRQQADNGLRGGGFPEPDSPTKASISPRWMEKLMLCTTSRHSPRER